MFSKIDVRLGYHQLKIWPKDITSTTVRTCYGHWKFLVTSFGSTNAFATFMSLMNNVFKYFMDLFFVVFINDISVYSKIIKSMQGIYVLSWIYSKEEAL